LEKWRGSLGNGLGHWIPLVQCDRLFDCDDMLSFSSIIFQKIKNI
jgi:hypothetical protein